MNKKTLIDENWNLLLSYFPSNWKYSAYETGAIRYILKDFNSESDLLRILLIYIGKGISLRETALISELSGITSISDVAILKRLRQSEQWLLSLCRELLLENGITVPQKNTGITVRIVDGSIIKEPGAKGTQWRLHFSFTVPGFYCNYFEISPSKGKGTGETFSRYPIKKGDYIMGDRGYSTATGIEYVDSCKAYVLVRLNTSSLPLYNFDYSEFILLENVKEVRKELEIKQWTVFVKRSDDKLIAGRLCVLRKTDSQIEDSYKKLKAKASRKQHKLKPETIEYSKYVIIFSTYPEEKFTKEDILHWYRIRWQVELIFKRLKTLLGIGKLSTFEPSASRAWLYGKLFPALLTEKPAQTNTLFFTWRNRMQKPVA